MVYPTIWLASRSRGQACCIDAEQGRRGQAEAPSAARCPKLRPLPSPGITRLQRYHEPFRHPSAPGLSLTVVRLIFLITRRGFPCCVCFPRKSVSTSAWKLRRR
jgi:hypothetical protein